MQDNLIQLKQGMRTIKISEASLIIEDMLLEAEEKSYTYQQFLSKLLTYEQQKREEKQLEKRLKAAAFPEYLSLDNFNLEEQESLSKKQFNQLKEFDVSIVSWTQLS